MRKKRFNIVDIGIILAVLLVAVLAVTRTAVEPQSFVYDGQDISRAARKYMELEREGFAVQAKVNGIDTNGNNISVTGPIVWSSSAVFVISENGRNISVGGPVSRWENVAAMRITLEKLEKVNVTEVRLPPKRVTRLEQLIPENAEGRIQVYAQIVLTESNHLVFQEILNVLRTEKQYAAIYPTAISNTLILDGADRDDIETASRLLGPVEGLSSAIIVRMFPSGEK